MLTKQFALFGPPSRLLLPKLINSRYRGYYIIQANKAPSSIKPCLVLGFEFQLSGKRTHQKNPKKLYKKERKF